MVKILAAQQNEGSEHEEKKVTDKTSNLDKSGIHNVQEVNDESSDNDDDGLQEQKSLNDSGFLKNLNTSLTQLQKENIASSTPINSNMKKIKSNVIEQQTFEIPETLSEHDPETP